MSADLGGRDGRFFESYVAAFARFDAAAIGEHFAFPLHIASDLGEVVSTQVVAADEWPATVEALLTMYREIAVATARIRELVVTPVTPRLVQARVDWTLEDAAGEDLYDFRAIYTLVESDGSLRVGALAHDEIPRLLASTATSRGEVGA